MKREIRCLAPRAHRLTPLVCPACAGGKGGASKSTRKLAALKATRAKRWPMMKALPRMKALLRLPEAEIEAELERAVRAIKPRS